MQRCLPTVAVVLFRVVRATLLADRYVAQAGQKPGSPYDSWSNAASNIQAAVNAAAAGETVWVSNGLYRATSSPVVSIAKSLNLRSVVTNSAAVIDGEGAAKIKFVDATNDNPAISTLDVGRAISAAATPLSFVNFFGATRVKEVLVDHDMVWFSAESDR